MGRIFDVVQKYKVDQTQTDEVAGTAFLEKDLQEDSSVHAPPKPPGELDGRGGPIRRNESARHDKLPPTEDSESARPESEPPLRGIEPVLLSESPPLAGEHKPTASTGSDSLRAATDKPKAGQAQVLRRFKDLRTAYVKGEASRTTVSKSGHSKFELIAVEQPDSLFAESFRIIRARLLHLMRERQTRIIQVTSCNPGEGKSFFSSNIAATIAQGFDESVLLVDADLRKPTQHQIYDTPLEPGLTDLLTDPARDVLELTTRTKIGKLGVLPAGSMHHGASELLDSDLMKMFLEVLQLRLDNRYIILDSPPLIISEALTLSRLVDGIVLIVDTRKTPRLLAQQAIELIGKDKILGVVMNNCTIPMEKYKYYGSFYKGYYRTRGEKGSKP